MRLKLTIKGHFRPWLFARKKPLQDSITRDVSLVCPHGEHLCESLIEIDKTRLIHLDDLGDMAIITFINNNRFSRRIDPILIPIPTMHYRAPVEIDFAETFCVGRQPCNVLECPRQNDELRRTAPHLLHRLTYRP